MQQLVPQPFTKTAIWARLFPPLAQPQHIIYKLQAGAKSEEASSVITTDLFFQAPQQLSG